VSRPRPATLALAAGYATLAVIVAAGALNWLDQWSVEHLMPEFSDTRRGPTLLESAVPLLHASWDTWLQAVANVVTVPAQALVASTLFAVCCLMLWRRGRTRTAVAWAAVWIAGNAVEVVCKATLSRPQLHVDGAAIVAFQSSYPSGHALRAVLLAAVAATVWPVARTWVGLWAAATLVLLELGAFHVPSDIVGGVLLALLLITVARGAGREAR
jgi:membrane-associated phospholipid phosphatase